MQSDREATIFLRALVELYLVALTGEFTLVLTITIRFTLPGKPALSANALEYSAAAAIIISYFAQSTPVTMH